MVDKFDKRLGLVRSDLRAASRARGINSGVKARQAVWSDTLVYAVFFFCFIWYTLWQRYLLHF